MQGRGGTPVGNKGTVLILWRLNCGAISFRR